MASIKEMQGALAKLGKMISVRQIAIQSGVNYITVRNIIGGKSKRITEPVELRLKKFIAGFNPDAAAAAPKRRGRKPGSKNIKKPASAPAVSAPKAAPPKGVTPKAAAQVSAAPAAAPKAAAPKVAAPKAAAPKTRKRRGRPPRANVAVAPPPASKTSDFASMIMGNQLADEIRKCKQRLEYLTALQKVEEAYRKAVK